MEIAKLTTGAFQKQKMYRRTVMTPAVDYTKNCIKKALNINSEPQKVTMSYCDLFEHSKSIERIARDYRTKSEVARILGGHGNIDFLL